MRKFILTAAILVAIFALCCACNPNTPCNDYTPVIVTTSLKDKPVLVGDKMPSFPLVTDGSSLNVLITAENCNPEDVYVWKKYQQMTGVKVNWTPVTKANRTETVTAVLRDKTNLDLIMRCKINSTDLMQYGEKGLLIDLAKDDLLKTYAPNCWEYLSSHPDALSSIMNPDGTIYSLPQINSGAELRVSRKIFINKHWLDNLDLEVPTTTEEFYQTLKAFKDYDANGNGDATDEIPFSSMDWASVKDVLLGAFGLANRGVHNQSVDFDETTGNLRFVCTSEEYQHFIEYLNKLYSEKLLDNYLLTFDSKEMQTYCTNKIADDCVGVFANTNLAYVPADKLDNWIALDEALEGPDGHKEWAAIRANFHSQGAAAIPATCKNPALVLKWLDYFWTDEGTLFYHMGVENETFLVKEDGSYDYMPYIYEEMHAQNKSFDEIVSKYTPYPGGNNPTVEIAPYFKGGETADIPANAARSLINYGPDEYWPEFTFTSEESARLAVLKSDLLKKYADVKEKEFISASTPPDWTAYLAGFDQSKVAEYLAIYKAAVDRYEALIKT